MSWFFSKSSAGGGSASAIDTFVRADANPLNSPMSDGVSTWETGFDAVSAIELQGNSIRGTAAATLNGARVTTPAFPSDQSASIKITTLSGFFGVLLRVQGSADNRAYIGYASRGDSGATISLAIIPTAHSTTNTDIGSPVTVTHGSGPGGALAIGDTVKWSAVGATISCYVNGVFESSFSDSTLIGGQPGLWIYDVGVTAGEFSAS